MTQPYPQYPGAQAYPGAVVSYPAPPQQYAPAAPAAPQAYGQPAAIAPTGGTAPGIPAAPGLVNGGGGGGGVSPKARHLVGRTVIVEPVRMGTATVKGKEIDEAVFHLTVVDGGPVRYGDNVDDRDPSKNRPNTHEIDTPCRFTNVTDIGFGFVQAVRDSLDGGQPARVGVIEQGQKGNRPYLISKCETTLNGTERPDGQARFQAATELWGKIWADKHAAPGAPRQFVSPEPRSLVAPPPAAAQQVNYGAPAQQQPAQPYGYPQPHGGAAPAYGQYTPPQQAAAPPASAPPVDPAYAAWQAQQQAAAAVQQAPAVEIPAPVQAWLASLPEGQREASRQAYLAQQGTQPATPAGPGI